VITRYAPAGMLDCIDNILKRRMDQAALRKPARLPAIPSRLDRGAICALGLKVSGGRAEGEGWGNTLI
jgi:hypothetical protein